MAKPESPPDIFSGAKKFSTHRGNCPVSSTAFTASEIFVAGIEEKKSAEGAKAPFKSFGSNLSSESPYFRMESEMISLPVADNRVFESRIGGWICSATLR